MTKSETLKDLIAREIMAKGPLTFADYMEMVLYHPGLGYYNGPGVKIGVEGDFYTSADVHSSFGQALAQQFVEMWEVAGRPPKWVLVEYGAGKGRLALHILDHLKNHYPHFMRSLVYIIVEISPYFTEIQKGALKEFNNEECKIVWVGNVRELPDRFAGCIFSNELVDSFPVHRICRTEDGIKEIYVDYDGDSFCEKEGPLSTPLLELYIREEGIKLAPGQKVEINLAARQWLIDLADRLQKGFILTIDYGNTARELYTPASPEGSLRCFFRHQLIDSPYLNIGRQDITANVNFSALKRWGKEAGLVNLGLLTQSEFLFKLGILDLIQKKQDYVFDAVSLNDILAIKKLLMPGGMGEVFKVLLQAKGFHGALRLKVCNFSSI